MANFKSINDSLHDTGINCLVHGPAGAGKTTLCGTTAEQTLIVSAESGLLSLQDSAADIMVAEVKTIDDISDVYQQISDGQAPFKWICLDSLSEIAEVVLTNEKENTKDPRQAYGALIDEMGRLVRAFRDLPYNTLVTCKQERIKDESSGSLLYFPAMPGSKLAQQLPYFFDFVFAYRVETNPEGQVVRVLQTNRDATHEAKDRSGRLDMFEEPDMASIYTKVIATHNTQAA